MEIKTTILTIEDFLEKRPEFISFQEVSIQSAINQAITMLDSECNGLISKVWDYNTSWLDNTSNDNFLRPDNSNELFRTQWELFQIMEAHIAQVQYSLNMGNDFTSGSDSFSIGGINGSFSRPLERKPIAPSVYKLLQNARVYNLQSFIGNNAKTSEVEYSNPYDQEPITRAIGDKRYVNIDQPNIENGNIAYVRNGKVDFGKPQDLEITTYNTKNILDTQTNNYVSIDKVKDLAFFGKNLYGYKSAVERGEILNLISLVNMNWNKNFFYKKDTLITAVQKENGKYLVQDFLALQDNMGKDPFLIENQGVYWEILGTVDIDINNLVDLTYDRVVAKYDNYFANLNQALDTKWSNLTNEWSTFKEYLENRQNDFEQNITTLFENKTNDLEQNITNDFNNLEQNITNDFNNLEQNITNVYVPREVQEQLNQLPTLDNILFHKNQIVSFTTKQDFQEIIDKYNLVENVDYEVLQNGSLLGVGENANIVGNGIIKKENLPNLNVSLSTVEWSYGSTSGLCNLTSTTNKVDFSEWSKTSGWKGIDATNKNNDGESYTWYLNDNQITKEFKPKYQEIFCIKFLKDIFKKQVANVNVDLTNYYNKQEVDNKYNVLVNNYVSTQELENAINSIKEILDRNNIR